MGQAPRLGAETHLLGTGEAGPLLDALQDASSTEGDGAWPPAGTTIKAEPRCDVEHDA